LSATTGSGGAAAGAAYDPVEAEALLTRTPRVLDALLRGLPAAWTECDEGPGTWSARVVVGHLLHGERTDWLPRTKHLLEWGEAKPFAPFDRFAQLAAPARPLDLLLDEFAAARRESLAELAALRLGPAHFARRGRHPALGAVELRHHLATWVVHDLSHLAQVERVMAHRWRDAVGPWQRYLRILGGRE